jgi:hypothetical protein
MTKAGIDQDALIDMFANATARQGDTLRKGVADAALKALQARELSVANVRKVLQAVAEAATAGAAKNESGIDPAKLLDKAFAGMDAAVLQAVEANRRALEQFVGQGVDLQDKSLKSALAGIEKLEDTLFDAGAKAAQSAAGPLAQGWQQVLESMKLKGTSTGAQASASVEQLMSQARDAVRDSRAAGVRAAQTLLRGYATLASGILIGMSEGLQPATPAARTRKT